VVALANALVDYLFDGHLTSRDAERVAEALPLLHKLDDDLGNRVGLEIFHRNWVPLSASSSNNGHNNGNSNDSNNGNNNGNNTCRDRIVVGSDDDDDDDGILAAAAMVSPTRPRAPTASSADVQARPLLAAAGNKSSGQQQQQRMCDLSIACVRKRDKHKHKQAASEPGSRSSRASCDRESATKTRQPIHKHAIDVTHSTYKNTHTHTRTITHTHIHKVSTAQLDHAQPQECAAVADGAGCV
jgi:hypothetical protein